MSDIRNYLPLWGQWNIENLLGESEDCKVYRAVRTTPDGTELSAIKHYSVAPSDDPAQSERKARALLALADRRIALRGKPNLAEYYDRQAFRRADGGYDVFVRMELLTSLRSVMGKTEFSEAMLSQLGQELCTGLAALEDAGTCHGDLHPANVFLSRDGSYKLGDFCCSGTRTVAGAAREYLAPEVLTGGSLPSAAADRYSVGMVLYRLSNGLRGPFLPPAPAGVSREDLAAAERRRLRGEALPAPANASDKLSAIVRRACAFEPKARYQTTDAFFQDCLRLNDPDAAVEPPAIDLRARGTSEKPQKRVAKKQKNPAFAVGVAAALILLAAFGVTALLLIKAQPKKDKPTEPDTTAAVTTAAPETTAPLTTVPPMTEEPTETEPPTTAAPETTAAPTYEFIHASTYNFVDFEIPASGYIIADSDTRYITEADLAGMTQNQCRLACNEIFARKGRIFTSKTISDYFGAMPWYKGTVDGGYFDSHISSYLTDIEQANASTILRYERSRGWQ